LNSQPLHAAHKFRSLYFQASGGAVWTGDHPIGCFERAQDLSPFRFLQEIVEAFAPAAFRSINDGRRLRG
jgi:hypothetical protein